MHGANMILLIGITLGGVLVVLQHLGLNIGVVVALAFYGGVLSARVLGDDNG